ncbi:MAG TPA: 2Fe-2S iron-sulfur cluster-binding protein [Saprospiraceae bacterium]|jgi:2Fe-2S ferredoxin|nr:2Fe-2S iron-sulfur cluster-binding protein [Saprospiraceae bacterium]
MEEVVLNIIDRDGVQHTVPFPNEQGYNLMEVLKSLEFEVAGTCGGMALCASCHVYVESETDLKEMSQAEILMLDSVFTTQSNSRLACQIPLSESINNIVIRLAPIE